MPSRRRADAARNDELFLDAGLELLRERGPDRIAALELARSAGLTTGAVYARYENPAEIMVGLWQHRIATPMRMFLENSLEALIDDSDTARASVTRALANPSGPLRPGVSMLIAATRIPELAEVVRPDLESWIADFEIEVDSDEARQKLKIFVAAALGCLMFATVDMFDHDDWVFLQRIAEAANSDRTVGRFPLPEPAPPTDLIVETGEPVRNAIVNGAARVIANGGIERATTQRIARAAGLQPNQIFSVYRTRSELFADVAKSVLADILSGGRSITRPRADHDDASNWQERFLVGKVSEYRSLLQPVHTENRRLRLEFLLAACHDDSISIAMHQVDQHVNHSVSRDLDTVLGIDSSIALRTVRLVRTSGFGALLLEELLGGYAELDLRYFFEPLVETMEESSP